MIIPPVQFNQNEWLVLVTMLALPILLYFTPKRFSAKTAIVVMLYNVAFSLTTDSMAGSSFPWDLYDTMDTSQYDLFDFFIYVVHYPIYGFYFAWFLSFFKNNRGTAFLFVVIWALVTTLLEWISVQFHVYQYKEDWSIQNSALFYLLYFLLEGIVVKWLLSGDYKHSAKTADPV